MRQVPTFILGEKLHEDQIGGEMWYEGRTRSSMDVERRTSQRTPVALAVGIDGRTRKSRFGISRDASATGMLIATPSHFGVGEELSLTVFLGVEERKQVRGRVTRVETHSVRSSEIWRYRLALEYSEPDPDLQASLASYAGRK